MSLDLEMWSIPTMVQGGLGQTALQVSLVEMRWDLWPMLIRDITYRLQKTYPWHIDGSLAF